MGSRRLDGLLGVAGRVVVLAHCTDPTFTDFHDPADVRCHEIAAGFIPEVIDALGEHGVDSAADVEELDFELAGRADDRDERSKAAALAESIQVVETVDGGKTRVGEGEVIRAQIPGQCAEVAVFH